MCHESTATPYERWGEKETTRGVRGRCGVTVQEEHDGLEEDRSDPEGRGARPPGRCSRSSRRAPRSCGCSRPSPWSSAPRLRRRRPPPQIVLRSAIFLIRKGASRPPAGSAARARPGRARGPWGRQYYEVPSRWRRLGPVNAGARAAAQTSFTPLLRRPPASSLLVDKVREHVPLQLLLVALPRRERLRVERRRPSLDGAVGR